MISQLDLFRSMLLKETLRVSFFRQLFLSRSTRILILSLVALSFYFSVSLFFPLWVLLIGPILWGVPHIISSLRYNTLFSSDLSTRKNLMLVQSIIWLIVFSYRIAIDIYNVKLIFSSYPLVFESICLMVSFVLHIYFSKFVSWKSFLFFPLFCALMFSTYLYPIETGLILLIGHNYIPLYSWFQSCQNRSDLKVFFGVSFIYIALSLAIFFGAFDSIYSTFSPQGHIGFLNWDYADLVTAFGGTSADYQFWFHVVCLYAFSQAMHYFFWMKAIPENYQLQEHPPSFRWSLNRLSTEFGSSSIYLMISLVLLGLAYWLFFEFQMARLVYFSIASYHGFMELSALPFLKSNRKK